MDQLPRLAASGLSRSMAEHATGDHLVGFYADEPYLTRAVTDFLAPALRAGDAAVVVATPDHRASFVRALADADVDIDAAVADDRLLVIDADDLLAQFLRGERTDARAFEAVVGEVLDRAGTGGRGVRVFGEMVSLLWERGNVAAVVDLEDAWNALAARHPFVLFCAYPLASFDDGDAAATFRAVMAQHSHVLPSEALAEPGGLDAHHRLVALLEQELASARAQLEQGARDRAGLELSLGEMRDVETVRNEFVSMVVHDIQSPATVVSALLGLLRSGWRDMPEDVLDDHLDTALQSIRRIERLTADIMTVARIDSGTFTYELRPMDVGAVIETAARDVSGATGRHIEVELPDRLPAVLADPDRQLQVLTNLLTNAVKFSSDGALVTVSTSTTDDAVTVHVRDEGVGIAPDEQAGLFLPFSRLRRSDRRVRGTGLGLHTAKALVEGQGGRIWVDSESGKGATFSYTVPLA